MAANLVAMMSRTAPLLKAPHADPDVDHLADAPSLASAGFDRIETLEDSTLLLRTALEHVDQGVVLLDSSHVVRACNARARELLDLPADVLDENVTLADIRAFQNARGDFSLMPPAMAAVVSSSDARRHPLRYDWPRPDNSTLDVRRVPLAGGASIDIFTDVTERRAFEAALRESEHRCRLLAERIEEFSQVDDLTGVLNRRSIMQTLRDQLADSERSGEPCAVAMIDLDFFKRINDRFGHPIGDEVLRSFAIAVGANARAVDRLGRYGGEEFLLVLPCIGGVEATEAVDRLRAIIADLDWSAISDELQVSVSAGVTQALPNEAVEDIVARADAALYRAKAAGRNCVIGA